jgi:hypothetical protein
MPDDRAAPVVVRPVGRLGRWTGSLSTSPTDPLRSKQAMLVAVVGVLLFLIALVFLTANSAAAQACISDHTSSFDLIQPTNACDSAYDAWRSGQRLMPIGVIGLLAAAVIAVGRGGLLAVMGAFGAGGRR